MAKRTPRENLKSFSYIYIILVVLYIGATILCNVMPEIANMFKTNFGKDTMIYINVATGVSTVMYLWYFWLARRVADGKSKGTLYMVLLILGIIGSIIYAFTQKGFSFLTIDSITDILGLYFLIQIRKED